MTWYDSGYWSPCAWDREGNVVWWFWVWRF